MPPGTPPQDADTAEASRASTATIPITTHREARAGATDGDMMMHAPVPVITPVHHMAGGVPPVNTAPPPTVAKQGGGRQIAMIGGAALGVLLLGVGGFLGYGALAGAPQQHREPAVSPPAASASVSRPAKPTQSTARSNINSEKTDPGALQPSDVFGSSKIALGNRTYTRAKVILNLKCGLTANGRFAAALVDEGCRRVVRATFVDGKKDFAVTAGIAVMPTRTEALATQKYRDPADYEWFRGMIASGAKEIDQAGGYALSTVKGRYIIYSYTTYADGKRPKSDDSALRVVGRRFLAYAAKPIEQRAR